MAKVLTIPRSGLVGEWKLDGDALDTSGSGYNGTATSVTYTGTTIGYQSQCASLSGTGYIGMGDVLPFEYNQPFSISAFINNQSTSSYNIVSKQESVSPWRGYGLGTWANGEIQIFLNNSSFGVLEKHYVTYSGATRHMVFTYDGSDSVNGLKLYVDGVLQTESGNNNTLGANTILSTAPFQISGRGGANNLFVGTVELARVFNRELSIVEIQTLYMEGLKKLGGYGLAPLSDGLVAYYDMNGDAQDIISGNNGTVTSATLTADRFGNANRSYNFNGTGYIGMGDVLPFEYNQPFSISAFINNQSTISVNIISKQESVSPWRGYGLGTWANGEIQIFLNNSSFGVLEKHYVTYSGATRHMVFTYDGSDSVNGLKLYVDGVLQTEAGSTNSLGANTILSTEPFQISGRGGANNLFVGTVEGVSVFNRALSASEVLALYQLESKEYITKYL